MSSALLPCHVGLLCMHYCRNVPSTSDSLPFFSSTPFLPSPRASIMHEEASQQAQVSTEMAREHQCLVRNRALQGTLTIEGGRPAVTSHYSLP